jgi:LuxR family transcriptional regulator, quorum-sensing system regulator BjaR1
MPTIERNARAAFELIDVLQGLQNVDAVMDRLALAFQSYGYENFVASGLPNPRQRFKQVCLARKWPPGWFELYEGRNFVHHDPVARRCYQTADPFMWSEAAIDANAEPLALEVMRTAADFGMAEGFCLPIHGMNGFEACFSLGAGSKELDPKDRPALHLMSMYSFEKLRRLLDPKLDKPRFRLTPRETEVLTWTAAGKSAWETGQILSITKRTVDQHAVQASAKLGARNKTQAVAIAVQARLISL